MALLSGAGGSRSNQASTLNSFIDVTLLDGSHDGHRTYKNLPELSQSFSLGTLQTWNKKENKNCLACNTPSPSTEVSCYKWKKANWFMLKTFQCQKQNIFSWLFCTCTNWNITCLKQTCHYEDVSSLHHHQQNMADLDSQKIK